MRNIHTIHARPPLPRGSTLAVALLCCSLWAAPHAGGATDSVDTSSSYRFRIMAFCRAKMPLRTSASSHWAPTCAGGIGLQLPTGLRRLSIQLRADIAALARPDEPSPDITLIELDLLAIWTGHLGRTALGADIGGGITSAMVLVERPPSLGQPLFTASESEYGFHAALEPFVHIRRWHFGVPLSFVWILSAPERFVHVDAGLSIGWEL